MRLLCPGKRSIETEISESLIEGRENPLLPQKVSPRKIDRAKKGLSQTLLLKVSLANKKGAKSMVEEKWEDSEDEEDEEDDEDAE